MGYRIRRRTLQMPLSQFERGENLYDVPSLRVTVGHWENSAIKEKRKGCTGLLGVKEKKKQLIG